MKIGRFENLKMNRTQTNDQEMNGISMPLRLRGKMFIKISVLVFLLSARYLTSSAQVSFGVKAGLNLSSLVNYERLEISLGDGPKNVGFYLGGYANIPFTKKFSFQPELQFSRRSSQGFNLVNLDYIELPILIVYAPFRTVQFEFGSNAGILISPTNSLYSNYQKNFDFGLTGGVCYNLPKGFFVGIRYYHGLALVQRIDGGLSQRDTYSRVLQFNVGYKIK